mgnify:CR=1 FL=1
MAKSRFDKREVSAEDKKKIDKQRLKKAWRLYYFIKPHSTAFIMGFVFLLLSNATILSFPFLTGKLIDAATGQGKGFFSNIDVITACLIAILFFQSIFSFFRIILFSRVSEKAMAGIRLALYEKMIYMPMSFFETRRVGELTSRITSDVAQLQDTLSITLAEFLRQFFTLVVGTAIILVTSTRLSLFMLATFPLLVVAAIFFGRYIRKLSKKTQDELANANIVVEETLQSVQVVKVFTNEQYEIGRYGKALENTIFNALKAAKYRGTFISFIIFALFGGIVMVLWYGAGLVSEGIVSIGGLTSFIIYTSFIGASVGGLGDMYGQLQKAVGSSERILDILEESSEKEVSPKENYRRFNGMITFNDVSFAYPTRKERLILSDFNVDILPGQKVALLGQSGAGKTTITQLLLRFYEISKGEIRIDRNIISDISLSELRKNIGLVPQEVLLFGGTIRENIAYGNPLAEEEDIIKAAEKANALEFINSFPEGFDTLVGDRGVKLSGGQRQRIAIARAILKNPPILILDEATSALDSASEMLVQQALNELMKGRTTIIIAHRLSTVRDADKIIVLNEGKVAEQGSHDELFEKQGLYYKMLTIQEDKSKSLQHHE